MVNYELYSKKELIHRIEELEDQILRQYTQATPIIALTAFAFDSDKDAALNAGCNNFPTKPISAEKLRSTLKKYI